LPKHALKHDFCECCFRTPCSAELFALAAHRWANSHHVVPMLCLLPWIFALQGETHMILRCKAMYVLQARRHITQRNVPAPIIVLDSRRSNVFTLVHDNLLQEHGCAGCSRRSSRPAAGAQYSICKVSVLLPAEHARTRCSSYKGQFNDSYQFCLSVMQP